jgi:hypothetical protein
MVWSEGPDDLQTDHFVLWGLSLGTLPSPFQDMRYPKAPDAMARSASSNVMSVMSGITTTPPLPCSFYIWSMFDTIRVVSSALFHSPKAGDPMLLTPVVISVVTMFLPKSESSRRPEEAGAIQ